MQWGNTMNHSGIRILTILPRAWPCAATPLRRRRRWWSSPEEGSFPSWTLRPPQLGRPSFSSLPPLGEKPLFSPPRLRGRSPPRSHRTMSPITLDAGNSSGFPWPSSWPSSPAPREVPRLAASSSVCLLGLRAKEPDNRSVWPSSASPIKGMGA